MISISFIPISFQLDLVSISFRVPTGCSPKPQTDLSNLGQTSKPMFEVSRKTLETSRGLQTGLPPNLEVWGFGFGNLFPRFGFDVRL